MKRKNKTSPIKNILKTLPVLFGAVAVIYVAVLIKDIEAPVLLSVNDIQIEGELKFLDEKEIMKTVTDNISDGYFTMDLKQMREILLQEPWVKDVSLRRKWPADVTVFIEEQKPIAFWNSDGYISEAGDVFRPASVDKELNLPQLSGPESQHENVLKFMNILYKKMVALNFDIKRLDLDDRRAWKLAIVNNAFDEEESIKNVIDVKLGRFDTDKRLQRFIRILPALTAELKMSENKIKVIDMRYPNGFAVQKVSADTTSNAGSVAGRVLVRKKIKTHNVTHNFVCARCIATVQMSEA